MSVKLDNEKEAAIRAIGSDPRMAHRVLFEHRHSNRTPPFHNEIIDLWHSDYPRVLIEAFRGAAKSSIAEEAITVQAALRRFKNGIILGETYERGCERLRAIKHEFENNDFLEHLFGKLVGTTWAEDRCILTNGVIIQVFGRGQSLRGSKHLTSRPDRAFLDDIENKESVASPEAIEKTMDWLMATVMPALEPTAFIRVNGTPLHPRSVICQLAADPGWVSRVYPIERVNPESGERESLWPDRFPMRRINDTRASYERLGLAQSYAQEFLCKAEDPASKPFKPEMIKVEPTVRTWQATYAMCDPARTIKATSASTGYAVWSWIGFKLVVWDAFAGFHKPDEIVAGIFKIDSDYRPVAIGVEKDGLEEFIMQPLRHEQVRRGYAIPIRDMKAPAGKLDFITSLQPFFKAGEVVFAKDCPDARAQFLSFPTGRIDIPNALAYALKLRPGSPMYDNFTVQNIAEDLPVSPYSPVFLAVNSDGRCTTAALMQTSDGGLRIFADWVRDGDPGLNLTVILQEAGLIAQQRVRLYAPPAHSSQYDTIGLRAAAKLVPCEIGRGGPELAGREQMRGLLGKLARSRPAFLVGSSARWTLNALAGGYAKDIGRSGSLAQEASEGPYRVLMEGIESFAALMKSSIISEDEMPANYAYTAQGRKYLTSRAANG